MADGKLEELTEEQWQLVYAERDRWLDRGMDTSPADRGRVQAAATRIYAAKDYQPPVMVWGQSPLSAALLAVLCRMRHDLDAKVAENGGRAPEVVVGLRDRLVERMMLLASDPDDAAVAALCGGTSR